MNSAYWHICVLILPNGRLNGHLIYNFITMLQSKIYLIVYVISVGFYHCMRFNTELKLETWMKPDHDACHQDCWNTGQDCYPGPTIGVDLEEPKLFWSCFVDLVQYFRFNTTQLDSLHALDHLSWLGQSAIVTCRNFVVVFWHQFSGQKLKGNNK